MEKKYFIEMHRKFDDDDDPHTEAFIGSSNGLFIVYSITDIGYFQYVTSLLDQVKEARDGKDVPIILVGNKCDP